MPFGISFFIPPLRLSGTSSQKEAFCSHLGEPATQWLWGGLFAFSYDCHFLSYRFPPLRHFVTPLLKERLLYGSNWGGAGNAVDCGVAFSYFHMTVIFLSYRFPPLRHFVTPLLKERLFVRLQLRGAVNAVDCGVAFYSFNTSLLIF